MKYKDVTGFLCPKCGWQRGRKCSRCGRKLQPGDSTQHEGIYGTVTYDCYRPPRPRSMTPIGYLKKFGCVDDFFERKTNGRYYCNPAHCHKSWKSKAKRDEHLKMAYSILN